MTINTVRNKRCGPGGSARRLHQISNPGFLGFVFGGETGSTYVVKVQLSSGMVPTVIGPNTINANDNEAFAVAA